MLAKTTERLRLYAHAVNPILEQGKMRKRSLQVVLICAAAACVGCKGSQNTQLTVSSGAEAGRSNDPATAANQPASGGVSNSATSGTNKAFPVVDVGLSVDQAYAAIPHRRTIWIASDSTASPEERAYLITIFQIVDQAIAVRVAGLQNYSRGEFDSTNIDNQFDQLLNFTRAMSVPTAFGAYHQDILSALSNERQFFQNWNAERGSFGFAQHYENHPAVRTASNASRAAYSELMNRFPNEPQGNKDAFYDYHCALDFL